MFSLTSKLWVAEVLISNLGLPAKVEGEYGYFSFTKVTFKKYRHRLSGNTFLTEECRLRLANKEKADWSSCVPGALLLPFVGMVVEEKENPRACPRIL